MECRVDGVTVGLDGFLSTIPTRSDTTGPQECDTSRQRAATMPHMREYERKLRAEGGLRERGAPPRRQVPRPMPPPQRNSQRPPPQVGLEAELSHALTPRGINAPGSLLATLDEYAEPVLTTTAGGSPTQWVVREPRVPCSAVVLWAVRIIDHPPSVLSRSLERERQPHLVVSPRCWNRGGPRAKSPDAPGTRPEALPGEAGWGKGKAVRVQVRKACSWE